MRHSRHHRELTDRVSTREEINFACQEHGERDARRSAEEMPRSVPFIPVEVLAELEDTEIVFLLDLAGADRTPIN